MLICVGFHPGDAESAQRFADWTLELGGAKGHALILIIDTRCTPAVVDPIIASFSKSFESVKRIDFADHYRQWPESANAVWSEAARYVYRNEKRPWFFCEPDLVLLRAGALDDFAAEYEAALKAKKFFVGDIIQDPVPHCSGCAIYPWDVYSHCGSALIAGNQAFDIAAARDTGRQTYQSELLLHVWKAPPFADQGDLEAKIFARRPKCALFHSAKDESLIRLLRERKNFSGDVERLAGAKPDSQHRHVGPNAAVDHPSELPGPEPVLPEAIGGCVPTTENSLPVPVLDENPQIITTVPDAERSVGCVKEARESNSKAAQTQGRDSRGGQFISDTQCIAECDQIWVKVDTHGNYLGTFELKDGAWVPAEFPKPLANYNLQFRMTETPVTQSCSDQTPWASQDDSVAEIRRLAARLKQFQTSSPRVRYVRSLLHEVGVIQLGYRYKRRKGWKRKKP